jgi:uncharacterized protein (TIGR02147 family)
MHEQLTSKDILRSFLVRKVENNRAYSARAFARDLGVSAAYVTMILNGKKKINLNRAIEIAQALKLTEKDKESLITAVLLENGIDIGKRKKALQLASITEEQFTAIADWYHLAILDLTTTKSFKPNAGWIAKRLGLKTVQVENAVQRLLRLGLLTTFKGTYKKANLQLDLPTKKSMAAVREHHKQMMEQAKLQLDKTDAESFEKRLIGSITFAGSSEKINEAKKRIADFQQEIADFMGETDCDEVFQLNLQFFTHTKKTEENL